MKFSLTQLGFLEDTSQKSGSEEETCPKSVLYCPELVFKPQKNPFIIMIIFLLSDICLNSWK